MASSSVQEGPAWQTNIIETLKKIKSGSRADTSFSPNVKKLETAFKKSDVKNINLHIDYFEKVLSKPKFAVHEKKAVEDAKQAIQKAKSEISTVVAGERGINSGRATGMKVQGEKIPHHANSSSDLPGHTDANQKEKDSEKPAGKDLAYNKSKAKADRSIGKNVQGEKRSQHANTSSSSPGHTDTNQKEKNSEKPAGRDLASIKAKADIKHEALEIQIAKLAEGIREDNFSEKSFQSPLHKDVKTIWDALCNVSTNDKASVTDSLPLDDEINLLLVEIDKDTYDIDEAKQRMKKMKNIKRKDVLILIRQTLTERKEIATVTINEIQHLKDETEKGEYNKEGFKKRKSKSRCKGDIWETISVIRDVLSQSSNTARELTEIKEEIEELRPKDTTKDQKPKGIPKEPKWQKDIALIKQRLSNGEQRELEYISVEEDISSLLEEINNGTYDIEEAKKRMKSTKNSKVKDVLLSIRHRLTERKEIMDCTLQEIEFLKDDAGKDEFNKKDFDKRKNKSKYNTGLWDTLSVIRDTLNQSSNSARELTEITEEVEKLRTKYAIEVQKPTGKPNEPTWKKDITLIKESLSNLEQREVEYTSFEEDIAMLQDELNTGTYDIEEAKTRMKNTKNSKVKDVLLSIRQRLLERKEIADCTVQCLKDETVRDECNKKDFNKRRNTFKYKAGLLDTLSIIRDKHNQSSNSARELTEITEEIEKLRQKYSFELQKSRGNPNEPTSKRDIDLIKESLSNMEQRISELNTELEDTQKQIGLMLDEMCGHSSVKETIGSVHKNLEEIRSISMQQKELLNRHSVEKKGMTANIAQLEKDVETLRVEKNDKVLSHGDEKNRMEADITQVRGEAETLRVEKNSLVRSHDDEKKRLVDEIRQLKEDVETTRVEKNDLLLRLSSIASAKLSDNNPNIADLSDSMRPTKIAEKYKEIYDSDWTDAYEVLENEASEHEICALLVQTLEEAEKYCMDIANLQKRRFLVTLFRPNETEDKTHALELNPVHSKMINDLRKQVADQSVKGVVKGFVLSVDLPSEHLKNHKIIKKYINKCVEICWYMSLQTPPVVLEKFDKKKAKFNKDKYAEYTHKGSKIAFVTWPPLLLHESGSLLCKGVAQGTDQKL